MRLSSPNPDSNLDQNMNFYLAFKIHTHIQTWSLESIMIPVSEKSISIFRPKSLKYVTHCQAETAQKPYPLGPRILIYSLCTEVALPPAFNSLEIFSRSAGYLGLGKSGNGTSFSLT